MHRYTVQISLKDDKPRRRARVRGNGAHGQRARSVIENESLVPVASALRNTLPKVSGPFELQKYAQMRDGLGANSRGGVRSWKDLQHEQSIEQSLPPPQEGGVSRDDPSLYVLNHRCCESGYMRVCADAEARRLCSAAYAAVRHWSPPSCRSRHRASPEPPGEAARKKDST